jgi:hypothetical protein
LTDAVVEGDDVLICLDETQVLSLDAEGTSSQERVLRVTIRSWRWRWTEYGGVNENDEVLGPGAVEFHAPSHS